MIIGTAYSPLSKEPDDLSIAKCDSSLKIKFYETLGFTFMKSGIFQMKFRISQIRVIGSYKNYTSMLDQVSGQ